MAVYSVDKIGWSNSLRTAYKCASGGDYEEAIKHYRVALKERANEVLIYNNLADTYMNAGQIKSALVCAEDAINRARGEVVPYVTLGEIYQTKGEHEKAVGCILKAQEIFEESVPELKDMVFGSIEEVIKKLSTKVKFDLASKDWVRIIYLVKSLMSNYEMERNYIKRGVSWELLLDIRKKSLSSIGQKYLWFKEKLGIKGNDATAIANTYGAMCAIIGSPRVKVLEKKEKYSRIQISACWQYSVIRSMGLDKDPGWIKCSCMCAEYINTIARAINPNVSFKFNSTLADGCRYCEGIFKTRIKNIHPERKSRDERNRMMGYKKPKTSGYSTGRGTRVKHSTSMDWDEWAEKRRKYPVKYATGEDGQIIHSTGVEFDKKAKYRRKEYEENKRGGARHPGFTYKHYKKKDKLQSENDRKISPKSFKKVTIDY